jgi:alpha-N-arabinofuranosidase
VLRTQIESETYDSAYYDPRGTEEQVYPVPNVPYLKLSAVATRSGGLSLFLLNRDLKQEMDVSIEARSFGALGLDEALELRHDNLQATNTRDDAEQVKPMPLKGVSVDGGQVRATLQPASWNVIHLAAN